MITSQPTVIRRARGFTLIELLVVISIIALLVSILLPALNEAKSIARRTVGVACMKQIGTGFHTYAADFDGLTPPSELPIQSSALGQIGYGPLNNAGGSVWYSENTREAGNSFYHKSQNPNKEPKWWSVGCLYNTGIIDTHKIFYPQGHIRTSGAGATWSMFYDISLYTAPTKPVKLPYEPYLPGTWVWENYPKSGRCRIPFNYFRPSLPLVPNKGLTARKLDKIGMFPFFFDIIHHWNALPYKKSNGQPRGLTVLYGDSHVDFRADKKLFDQDILIATFGSDPWNRFVPTNITTSGPGNNANQFLKIYLTLCNLENLGNITNPDPITPNNFLVADERAANFWK